MDTIKLTSGKTLKRIDNTCCFGESVVFTYVHHYNSRSQADRFIDSEFIRYCKGRKKVIIKRKDCQNQSRVNIDQVYQVIPFCDNRTNLIVWRY